MCGAMIQSELVKNLALEATCTQCKKEKGVEHFNSLSNSLKTGRCTSCHSLRNIQKTQLSKALKNPTDYMECENCFRIFFKWKGNRAIPHELRTKKFEKCRYCNSKDLNEFSGNKNQDSIFL